MLRDSGQGSYDCDVMVSALMDPKRSAHTLAFASCMQGDHLQALRGAPIAAVLKKVAPYLSIPGLTVTPTRFHRTSTGSRKSLKLAVACNAVAGMFIQEVTGTKYEGFQKGSYEVQGKDGPKPATSMNSEEYLHFVGAAWAGFKQKPAFRTVSKGAMLIHDKSRVHTSKKVQDGLKALGLAYMVQPPRSPDLMPLDYGIFGSIKVKLARAAPRLKTWEEKVQAFKSMLLEFNPAPTISQFQLRIARVIEREGKHIELGLKKR